MTGSIATGGTISAEFARYAFGLSYDALPADVKRLAKLVLLDTLGCALAGASTDEVTRIGKAMRAAFGEGGSLLWGTSAALPLPAAALVNGAACHAREMDDFGGCAHSGSVVVPAALGMATSRRSSGRELLTAIVIGYDVARRAMDGGGGYNAFKKKGWHSTSTCGGFGAAAAAGRLLGLDERGLQWALGYAGSNAGGTWAFIPDGAMNKRVHPGFAAQTGIMAAHLASEGVTAPTGIFETEWGGFFSTYVPGVAKPDDAVAGLGSDFRIRLVGIKPYAACRGIHSALDVVLDLRSERGITHADVARVVIRGSSVHQKQLGKQVVRTTLDAQMSLPYSVAVALVSGSAGLDQFDPTAIHRPEITHFAKMVEVVRDGEVADGEEPFVDVHMHSGEVITRRVLVARGDAANPLSDAEVRAKFRTTAGTLLALDAVAALERAVDGIDGCDDVTALTDLLRTAEPTSSSQNRRNVA